MAKELIKSGNARSDENHAEFPNVGIESPLAISFEEAVCRMAMTIERIEELVGEQTIAMEQIAFAIQKIAIRQGAIDPKELVE